MTRIKEINCDDCGWRATGVYTGVARTPDTLQAGDEVEILWNNITVLVDVDSLEGNNITGIVRSFENTEEESVSEIKRGDMVAFKLSNVREWH